MFRSHRQQSRTGVALTQISAYITLKNLAVRKIVEAMRTAYTKGGTRSQHVSNYIWHVSILKGKRASFAKNISLPSMNLVIKVLLKYVISLSISFRWYAVPNFCTQICRPVAYGVRTSSKASATAAHREFSGRNFRRCHLSRVVWRYRSRLVLFSSGFSRTSGPLWPARKQRRNGEPSPLSNQDVIGWLLIKCTFQASQNLSSFLRVSPAKWGRLVRRGLLEHR